MLTPADQIVIRPAVAGDAADIARVHVESWRSTYAGLLPDEVLLGLDSGEHEARWWRHVLGRFRSNHLVNVAADGDGRIIGFSSAGPSRQRSLPYRAEVYTIYLRDDFHGCGIGRRLFSATVAGVGAVRGPSVIVWCLSANPSRYFYEHLGGALVARRPSKVGVTAVEEVGYAWEDVSAFAEWGRA